MLLEVVAAADGARRPGGKAGPGHPVPGALDMLKDGGDGVAGDLIVPQVVAHLLELVEDHHVGLAFEPVGLVEDLLHVGLAAGGCDDLTGDGAQPVETLPAHALGEDGNRVHRQQLGIEGAAPAVVAGGRPDGVICGGVELTCDQTGYQTAVGGSHLMAAGGKPLSHQAHDAGGDAGERGGQLDVIGHVLIEPAGLLGLVFPGDAEEIEGIHVPKPHSLQPIPDDARNGLGVLHLPIGGDNDAVFAGLADVVGQVLMVDGQVDHGKTSFINRPFLR